MVSVDVKHHVYLDRNEQTNERQGSKLFVGMLFVVNLFLCQKTALAVKIVFLFLFFNIGSA